MNKDQKEGLRQGKEKDTTCIKDSLKTGRIERTGQVMLWLKNNYSYFSIRTFGIYIEA